MGTDRHWHTGGWAIPDITFFVATLSFLYKLTDSGNLMHVVALRQLITCTLVLSTGVRLLRSGHKRIISMELHQLSVIFFRCEIELGRKIGLAIYSESTEMSLFFFFLFFFIQYSRAEERRKIAPSPASAN